MEVGGEDSANHRKWWSMALGGLINQIRGSEKWLPVELPPREELQQHAAANLRRRRTTSGGAAGGTSGTMLQFYTDDAPGLKISPNVVLVMSIGFIAFVAVLHVMGKLYFVRREA
ncbi:protein transport protein Sec61 subunit beta-like [Forsythia ovata]|uniref:Protein transport protein Sec61 subunit beta-like n=1 Tax=Forsythia ovata TaxID=205694 RepID=A0ABD1VGU2_9LAMI